jgi:predicted 2-oxoglutarate/Fe(II)-dependent dioxygenase YbiX
MYSLGILSLFLSLVVLFLFIIFIQSTRNKILELDSDLQQLTSRIENAVNKIVTEVNKNNNIILKRIELGSS